jgi:hypothetical protein
MSRFLRYLRIAFSATCLIACVLLIALWVRSYWWMDTTGFIADHILASIRGRLLWDTPLKVVARPGSPSLATYATARFGGTYTLPLDGILVTPGPGGTGIAIWIPALLAAILTAIPWMGLKWRFSLRTLLIATTLVAVVLGLIVWLSRS